MTRVTIGLTLAGLIVLFIAYAKGVGVIHGGDMLSHMYWATARCRSWRWPTLSRSRIWRAPSG